MTVAVPPGQSIAVKYLLSQDLGQFIRTQEEYLKLTHGWYSKVPPHSGNDVVCIPYLKINFLLSHFRVRTFITGLEE